MGPEWVCIIKRHDKNFMKLPLFIDEKPLKNYRKLIGSAMSLTPLSWFHGVNDTAELISRCQGPHWADFTVPRTPLSWFHGAKDTTELISRGVKDPTELISRCQGPTELISRCQGHHRVFAYANISAISKLYSKNLSIWIRGSEALESFKKTFWPVPRRNERLSTILAFFTVMSWNG